MLIENKINGKEVIKCTIKYSGFFSFNKLCRALNDLKKTYQYAILLLRKPSFLKVLKIDLSNFNLLRKEVLNSIPNFSKINELPIHKDSENKNKATNFASEKVLIKELDYFYTNSISRASKTMSECRQINKDSKKTGTNN